MDTHWTRPKDCLPSFTVACFFIKSMKWQTKQHFSEEPNTLKIIGFSITSGNWDKQISTAKSHACLPGKKGKSNNNCTYLKSMSKIQNISVIIIIINVKKCLFTFTQERKIVCLQVCATPLPPLRHLLLLLCSRYLPPLSLHLTPLLSTLDSPHWMHVGGRKSGTWHRCTVVRSHHSLC